MNLKSEAASNIADRSVLDQTHRVLGQLLPGGVAQGRLLQRRQVVVEVGEGVPGRAHSHPGQPDVRYGQRLDGGGDRTVGPVLDRAVSKSS